MAYITPRTFRALCLIVFLAGIVSAGIVYAPKYLKLGRPPVGFTLSSTHTLTIKGDPRTPLIQQKIVRYQKSNGDWYEVKTTFGLDGSVQGVSSEFGQSGRGVFQIDEAQHLLMFISSMPATKHDLTEDSLRNNPHFNRTESILGYLTFVLHYPDEDGEAYSELYVTPALQSLPIKTVKTDAQAVRVIEPTRIELGEPDEVHFHVPDYKVSYDFFEKKIRAMVQAGHPQEAERMREALHKQQQVLP